MDARLQSIDAEAAQRKAAAGHALTIAELALVRGLTYAGIRRLAQVPGFPMAHGVIFLLDFDLWRQAVLFGLPVAKTPSEESTPRIAAHRQPSSAGKSVIPA